LVMVGIVFMIYSRLGFLFACKGTKNGRKNAAEWCLSVFFNHLLYFFMKILCCSANFT